MASFQGESETVMVLSCLASCGDAGLGERGVCSSLPDAADFCWLLLLSIPVDERAKEEVGAAARDELTESLLSVLFSAGELIALVSGSVDGVRGARGEEMACGEGIESTGAGELVFAADERAGGDGLLRVLLLVGETLDFSCSLLDCLASVTDG